jgi:hypothetical protein
MIESDCDARCDIAGELMTTTAAVEPELAVASPSSAPAVPRPAIRPPAARSAERVSWTGGTRLLNGYTKI